MYHYNCVCLLKGGENSIQFMFTLRFVLITLKMQLNKRSRKRNKIVDYNLIISNCMGQKKTHEFVLLSLIIIVINRPLWICLYYLIAFYLLHLDLSNSINQRKFYFQFYVFLPFFFSFILCFIQNNLTKCLFASLKIAFVVFLPFIPIFQTKCVPCGFVFNLKFRCV